MPIRYRAYDFKTLSDYPIDMTAKCNYKGPKDEAGIPMLDYKGEEGVQYNPCATAQYALGFWQHWRDGDKKAYDHFERQANWLRKQLTPVAGTEASMWYYHFTGDGAIYGVSKPFVSGLAQAQGLQVLLRQAKVRNTGELQAAIRRAWNGLILPIEQGGVWRKEGELQFIEEVASPRLSCILDGFMFAILAVADYHFATGDADAKARLEMLLDTLKRVLSRFDLGYWSSMDLWSEDKRIPASPFYHRIHIAQLHALAEVSGDMSFSATAACWQRYLDNPMNRTRAIAIKIFCKLVHY